MLIVGLTGGIATGKSLVAGVFRDRGAVIIDGDSIAHDLLEPGQEAWAEVKEHFGQVIALPDGRIDRHRLGEIVFKSQAERAWLNACLHPKIFDVFRKRLGEIERRDPGAVVVFEAALLVETGYYKNLDRLIVVHADREQQIERLRARNGYDRKRAISRIDSQMTMAEKCNYADYVIDNNGMEEQARRKAEEIFDTLAKNERFLKETKKPDT